MFYEQQWHRGLLSARQLQNTGRQEAEGDQGEITITEELERWVLCDSKTGFVEDMHACGYSFRLRLRTVVEVSDTNLVLG
jgi:hypothetical protein